MINSYDQVTSETNFEGDVQLTSFTDYALRALIYMATLPEGKMTSISEVTELYKLSRHQMVKIVNQLGHEGLVSASRGKKGGIRLGRPAAEINIGDVVRQLEPVELINCDTSLMTSSCDLKKILHQAMQQFLQELDNYTLADIAHYRDLKHIFISDAAEIKTY